MTMHRTDVSLHFDVPRAPATVPAVDTSHPTAVDATISEWIADLGTRAVARPEAANAPLPPSGFVDFDALDSVHESSSPSLRR
jgi:hypothetical protein